MFTVLLGATTTNILINFIIIIITLSRRLIELF
jgi:hypothetical protein